MTELLQTEARPQGTGAPGTDPGFRRGPWLARVLALLASFAVIAIFVLLVVAHAAGAAGGCGGG